MKTRQLALPGRQRGVTFLGWAFLLVAVAFLVFLGVRIIPVYMNEYKIVTAFKEIKKDPQLASASPHLLTDRLSRHFDVDDVRYVTARDAQFRRTASGGMEMSLSYQVEKPLFGNIDLVFKFHPKVRLEGH